MQFHYMDLDGVIWGKTNFQWLTKGNILVLEVQVRKYKKNAKSNTATLFFSKICENQDLSNFFCPKLSFAR